MSPSSSGAHAVRRRSAPPGATVRWDRLGRMAMLAVLVFLLYLYAGAARSYLFTRAQAGHTRAQVRDLERQDALLRARRAALFSPVTIEREARRLGMVRPGERSYVITGLPRG